MNSDRMHTFYVDTAVCKGWHLCRANALLIRTSYIAVRSSSKTLSGTFIYMSLFSNHPEKSDLT